MPTGTTALILPVPEAEYAVRTWRARFDKHAAQGVPAHITLLAPFLPTATARRSLREVRSILGRRRPRFRLDRFERWDELGVLCPAPGSWFQRVSRGLCDRFSLLPYGGKHGDVIQPHLTVAYGAPVPALTRARFDAIEQALQPFLPLQCEGREVQLIERVGTRWQVAEILVLGSP